MKNSLSRRLFQKYGLPPRGYQWGATSFLPTQGTVRGHGQHYHYKDGSVKWKDKDPYPRGGNNEE